MDSLVWQIKRFRTNVDYHNIHHPGRFNSFAVAPVLLDNGPHSSTYVNRRGEVEHLNDWIRTYNSVYEIAEVPGFHVMGTRSCRRVVNGVQWEPEAQQRGKGG